MTAPTPDWGLIEIRGRFRTLAGEIPAEGSRVILRSPEGVWWRDPDNDTIVSPGSFTVDLDTNGEIPALALRVPSTDDADVWPVPFSYTLTVELAGQTPWTWALVVPGDTPGGVLQLADVAPAVSVPEPTVYVLRSDMGVPLGVATLDASGTVPPEQLPPSSAAVTSVNGETGTVVISAGDIGALDSTLLGAPDGVASLASNGRTPPEQTYREMRWVDVREYGALGNDVADDYAALQAAIDSCSPGDVLWLGSGIYRTSRPLEIPRHVSVKGNQSPRWPYLGNYMPARIKIHSATWSGTALILLNDREISGEVNDLSGIRFENVGLDGVGYSTSNVDAIRVRGKVSDVQLRNVTMWNFYGHGINWMQYTRADTSVQFPSGWEIENVVADNTRCGFRSERLTDASFNNCLAVEVKEDGFYLSAPSDVHLADCRAVFNQQGYGFRFDGNNGSLQLSNCSTDRNMKDGCFLNFNDTRHVVVLSNCIFRRDGFNDDVSANGYAGLRIEGTSLGTPHCPVVVVGAGSHVARNDVGAGLASPDYGVRISNARQVSLVGCILAGTVGGILDSSNVAQIVGCKFNITNSSFVTTWDGTGVNRLNGVAGSDRRVEYYTSGSGPRWSVGANSTAEGGSNAGSNFVISRYSDAGAFLTDAVIVERSTGHVGIGTSSPSARLHLERSDTGPSLLLRNTNGAGTSSAIGAVVAETATSNAFQTGLPADTIRRFNVEVGGTLAWGAGGASARDTNLYRIAANQLRTDDTLIGNDGVATKVKAGIPVDGDFATTPVSGTIAIDTTNNRIYVRVGTTWRYAALT